MVEGDGLENRIPKGTWVRILPPPPHSRWERSAAPKALSVGGAHLEYSMFVPWLSINLFAITALVHLQWSWPLRFCWGRFISEFMSIRAIDCIGTGRFL